MLKVNSVQIPVCMFNSMDQPVVPCQGWAGLRRSVCLSNEDEVTPRTGSNSGASAVSEIVVQLETSRADSRLQVPVMRQLCPAV